MRIPIKPFGGRRARTGDLSYGHAATHRLAANRAPHGGRRRDHRHCLRPQTPDRLRRLPYACPAGFDAEDYAACRAHPLAGVGFTVAPTGRDNGIGGATDATGVADFPLFAADLPGDIAVSGQLPAGSTGFEAACQSEPGIAAEYAVTERGVTLLGVAPGAAVVCDWFILPAAATATQPPPTEPTAPAPAPRAPAAAVAKLPDTGTGGRLDHEPKTRPLLLGLFGGLVAAGLLTIVRAKAAG